MNQVVPASEALASRADSAVSVANRTIPIYGDSKPTTQSRADLRIIRLLSKSSIGLCLTQLQSEALGLSEGCSYTIFAQ